MLVDRGEIKGYFIQAGQVWFGNSIPGHGRPKKESYLFLSWTKKDMILKPFCLSPWLYINYQLDALIIIYS